MASGYHTGRCSSRACSQRACGRANVWGGGIVSGPEGADSHSWLFFPGGSRTAGGDGVSP